MISSTPSKAGSLDGMMQSPPIPQGPLLELSGVRVFANSVQTPSGTYDPRAIDGVEFAAARVDATKIIRDIAGAAAFACLWSSSFGSNGAAAAFGGGLLAASVGWWWTGNKHAATILVRGVRVVLAVTDEVAARKIGAAVLQAVAASR